MDAEIAADNKRADGLELVFDSDGRTDAKGGTPAEQMEVVADPAADDERKANARATEARAFAELERAKAELVRADVDKAKASQPPAAITVDARTEVHPQTINVKTPKIDVHPSPITVESTKVDVHAHIPRRGKIVKSATAFDKAGRITEMTEHEVDE